VTRRHQLEASLRSLGLSGMLDTLEARLAQAHAGELGHVEFLEALCEDEVSRRQAAALERRVRAARFERICTLEEFDFTYVRHEAPCNRVGGRDPPPVCRSSPVKLRVA